MKLLLSSSLLFFLAAACCWPAVFVGGQQLFERSLDPQDENKLEGKALMDIIVTLLWGKYKLAERTSDFPTAFTTANISEQCRNDSLNYYAAHLKQITWAQKMYESSGHYPEGFRGNLMVHSLGLFDECLATRAKPFNKSGVLVDVNFPAKYCSVFFTIEKVPYNETDFNSSSLDDGNNLPPLPEQRDYWLTAAQLLQLLERGPTILEPRQGETTFASPEFPSVDFCIPASCSMEDFRSAVAYIVGKRPIFSDSQDNFYAIATLASEGFCWTREEVEAAPDFDGPDIAVLVTLSLIGALVLAATLHEAWRDYSDRPIDTRKDPLAIRTLNCFSLLYNSKKILSTKVNSSENLACLNGIRFLSTTWVIMGHTYALAAYSYTHMYDNAVMFEETHTWQFHGAVTMATVSVDTFFLMSGLLVSYLLLRELDRTKGRFNVPLFYIHRYLRLTPVYAIILGFNATLLVYVDVGPFWQTMHSQSEVCRVNWWNNLLYINNYVSTFQETSCMRHTWYLACDMQMFLLSPLFIYPLWKWWKMGLAWNIFSIVAIQGGLIAIYIIWELPAIPWNSRPIEMNRSRPTFTEQYYIQMWTRFPPYLFGIILGWILHRTRNSFIKIDKWVVTAGWMIATATGLAIAYGLLPYVDELEVREMNDFVRVFFGSFHRLAWSIAVGWVIFACIKGYGGFVNRLLSWNALLPLGRLTFVAYLIHYDYLNTYWAHVRKPYYYTIWDHLMHYMGALMIIFLLSFLISATVEASFLNLEKLAFNRFHSSKPVETNNKTQEENVGDLKIPRPSAAPPKRVIS